VEAETNAACVAVLVAVAVSRVPEVLNILGHEGDETETVGDELVGEDGAVDFDLDEVDGEGGDFGLDYAADGVCEGEVGACHFEIYSRAAGLEMGGMVRLMDGAWERG